MHLPVDKLRYSLIYWLAAANIIPSPRWDTGITPPEVLSTLPGLPPGQALDLGCGTGTNAVYLAKLGWQVVGVDFAGKAVHTARRRARATGVEAQVAFLQADVSRMEPARLPSSQFVLDIGCFHRLGEEGRRNYRLLLATSLETSGLYLLYAHFPGIKRGMKFGISMAQCTAFFAPAFSLEKVEHDQKSAWYWLRKRE